VTTVTNLGWRVLRLLLLAMLFNAATSTASLAQPAPVVDEAQIRAAMIFNLTRYVEWPAWKFSEPSAPFVLCFFANDAVGDDADLLVREHESRERSGQDRKLTVRRVSSVAAAASCHILYASKLDRKKFIEVPAGASKWAVLTISDNPAVEGSVVSLPMVDSRVQIVVDLKVAQQSGLTLSSKLLKIATVSR
jgi:YfiR/HmsC-like